MEITNQVLVRLSSVIDMNFGLDFAHGLNQFMRHFAFVGIDRLVHGLNPGLGILINPGGNVTFGSGISTISEFDINS